MVEPVQQGYAEDSLTFVLTLSAWELETMSSAIHLTRPGKRIPRRLALAVLPLLLGLGCVSDEAARYYMDVEFPPKRVEDVQVLNSLPSRPHQVIADFQARGASIGHMRKKAAAIGADAVIVSLVGGYRSRDDEWASEDSYRDTYSRITATAIRYTGVPVK